MQLYVEESGKIGAPSIVFLHLESGEQVAFVENFMKMSMMNYRTIYEEVDGFKASSALAMVKVPTLICGGGKES